MKIKFEGGPWNGSTWGLDSKFFHMLVLGTKHIFYFKNKHYKYKVINKTKDLVLVKFINEI